MAACNEVSRLLIATGDSLAQISSSLEAPTSKKVLRGFTIVSTIIQMFSDTVPIGTEESPVLETVGSFHPQI